MVLSLQEVSQHNKKDDCWVIIHDKAYDLSDFMDEHPGGLAIIMKYAGKDATKAFDPIHPGDTLTKYLQPKYHKGEVEKKQKRRRVPLQIMAPQLNLLNPLWSHKKQLMNLMLNMMNKKTKLLSLQKFKLMELVITTTMKLKVMMSMTTTMMMMMSHQLKKNLNVVNLLKQTRYFSNL